MNSYILFIKKFRKPLLLLLIIMNIIAIIGITKLSISGDFKIFVPEVSENQELLNEMNQLFPSSDQIIYMIPIEDDLTFDSYAKLSSFQEYLTTLTSINRYRGPAPKELILGNQNLMISENDPTSISILKSYYELLGEISPIIVHEGTTYGLFTIFIDESFDTKDIHAIEAELAKLKLEYFATGDTYMQLLVFDYISTILKFIPPLALFFVLLIFGIQLQSIKGTFLSILPAAMGSLWTMGLIGWIGKDVSIVTVLAPIFTIVIGSADGLHFISHVQDEEAVNSNPISSLSKTLGIVGKPMIITTITSMVGFLALLTMNTNAIKDLAIFASIGILFAGIITWYVLPLILVGNTHLTKRKGKSSPMTFDFLKKTWGLPAYGLILIGLIIFIIGAPKIATEFNMLMVYKENTDIYKNTTKIQEINGGSIPIYVYGQTATSPFSEESINLTNELYENLIESDAVSKVMSPYKIIETLKPIILANSDIPIDINDPKVNKMVIDKLSTIDDSPLNDLINSKENGIKLIVFPVNLENDTLNTIRDITNTFNVSNPLSNTRFKTTGIQFMMMDLNASMFKNQLTSTSLAMIIVLLLLIISLKALKPALISLVPILVTTGFLLGFLGLTGISLNILTTTIFSITIGVGIDYAIHYTSVYMHLKKEGLSSNEAVVSAYSYAARPIIANALGLSLGLSSLLLSPLQIHVNVSLLMWTTMTVSVLFSLTYLPSALRRLK